MSARRHAKETFTMTSEVTGTFATLVTELRAADATTRGIPIDDGRGVTAVVSVPVTETIVSGVMRCYVYMPVDRNADGSIPSDGRRWVKYPALDVDLISDTGISASTERDIPLGDKHALSGAGRIVWIPDTVTGSSGSALLTVTYSANRWGPYA